MATKTYAVDVNVAKKIKMYQNGIWKDQPHLEFLWNICGGQKIWFDFHVASMKKFGQTVAHGIKFKLEAEKF